MDFFLNLFYRFQPFPNPLRHHGRPLQLFNQILVLNHSLTLLISLQHLQNALLTFFHLDNIISCVLSLNSHTHFKLLLNLLDYNSHNLRVKRRFIQRKVHKDYMLADLGTKIWFLQNAGDQHFEV